MEVEVNKENICINKLICQKKELIFVHNDMIVPDAKPDILNTINSSGNICIYKKEVLDDKIKIEGSVNVYIMYLPDSKDDNLRALNCNLDFSETIACQGVREGMTLILKPSIKDIECKVLNGRKISLKAGIEFNIKVYSNEDVEIINSINNIEDIQILPQDFKVNSLIGNGRTTVYAKDTLNLKLEDELAEVLKVDLALVNQDLKISYNKVLAKSELDINIMYLTEDNRIESVNGKIPIVGFIDIPNITEDNICDINYEMKNMIIKLNPAEEHSIYIEFEIEATCMAFEKKQISLIQDLYSPRMNLEFTLRKISSSSERIEKTTNFTVNSTEIVSELEDANILDVETNINLSNIQITNTKIMYSGEVNLNFIFTNSNAVNSTTLKIPFETSEDNVYGTDKINVETNASVENTDFNLKQNGEVDCKIDICLSTKTSQNVSMNLIDDIDIVDDDENDQDYNSLVLYIVKPGDTLWKIAKNFNTTVDEISRMNGIGDQDKIFVGQKFYIPKFNYMRKERNENTIPAVNV